MGEFVKRHSHIIMLEILGRVLWYESIIDHRYLHLPPNPKRLPGDLAGTFAPTIARGMCAKIFGGSEQILFPPKQYPELLSLNFHVVSNTDCTVDKKTIHPQPQFISIAIHFLADWFQIIMSRNNRTKKSPPDILSAAYLEGASGKKVRLIC
jgi:hypothetical protein